jgi:hypothetical protein
MDIQRITAVLHAAGRLNDDQAGQLVGHSQPVSQAP